MSSVAVIDYGMGNLHSIHKALLHVAPTADVWVTSEKKAILHADRVVFPGVGAIRDCINALHQSGLDEVISHFVQTGKPMLGICLGMQALLTHDEENGGTSCLNLIPGEVVHFPEPLVDSHGEIMKIPHMGWNQVKQKYNHPLWNKISQESRFYFVHSYFAKPEDDAVIVATADYPDSFTCALARENVFAVQFHPEKSQAAGLQLLNNFLLWDGSF
jgi:glutamine amidotransferase